MNDKRFANGSSSVVIRNHKRRLRTAEFEAISLRHGIPKTDYSATLRKLESLEKRAVDWDNKIRIKANAFDALVDMMPHGVMLAKDGCIVYATECMVDMFGKVVGKIVMSVLRDKLSKNLTAVSIEQLPQKFIAKCSGVDYQISWRKVGTNGSSVQMILVRII